MDLYPTWPVYLPLYAILARLARVPLALYGVGAGPLASWRGRLCVAIAIRLSSCLCVRDEYSAELLRRHRLAQDVPVVPDPALSIPPPRPAPRRGSSSALTIGVNVLPFYAPHYWQSGDERTYSRYVRSVSELLRHVMALIPGRMEFFSMNFPADRDTALDVAGELSLDDRVLVIEERLSIRDILMKCASFDFTIVTRLHAAILSVVAGTPFVSLAYQPKVKAFCESLGLERYVYDLDPTGPELLTDRATAAEEIAAAIHDRDSLARSIEDAKQCLEKSKELGRGLLEALLRQ